MEVLVFFGLTRRISGDSSRIYSENNFPIFDKHVYEIGYFLKHVVFTLVKEKKTKQKQSTIG